VAAYSIYSQLPSIAEGRSSIHKLRTRRAAVTGIRLIWQKENGYHSKVKNCTESKSRCSENIYTYLLAVQANLSDSALHTYGILTA
jgi:hypothetical protein